MRLHMSLEGEVAIVTGGGQGIGREIAFRLAQEGATVVIADVNEKGSVETAETILKNYGRKAKVIPTDITREEQVTHLVDSAFAIAHKIDILVNNAGITGPMKGIEEIDLREWEATMAVNLGGMFLCCKHTVPIMKRQERGGIINIASMSGKRPLAQRTPYTTSKMGVIGFTRTLAAEVGRWKIRVNSVCPGAVAGPRYDAVVEGIMKHSGKTREQVISEWGEASALKTFVDPKYVAGVVAFLCSEDAAMMTGQDINVSAGMIMY